MAGMTTALLIPVLPPGHNLVEADIHLTDGRVDTINFTYEQSTAPWIPALDLDVIAEIRVIDHGHQNAMFTQTTVTDAYLLLVRDHGDGTELTRITVDDPWVHAS